MHPQVTFSETLPWTIFLFSLKGVFSTETILTLRPLGTKPRERWANGVDFGWASAKLTSKWSLSLFRVLWWRIPPFGLIAYYARRDSSPSVLWRLRIARSFRHILRQLWATNISGEKLMKTDSISPNQFWHAGPRKLLIRAFPKIPLRDPC